MAEVYAARDTQLRRLVALKRLRHHSGDAAGTARLMREARASASFEHPGAVIVYDVFEHDGEPYMAMELVSGRTLRSYIGDASVPIERRVRWLIEVARTLGAAHRAGIVHRDVKPHNVMVRDDGVIKVLDFGIARAHQRLDPADDTSQSMGPLTEPGRIVGTPLYASPEQVSALHIDGRSDQFAWGVMGYELCCGLLPWRRRDTMTMLAQLVSNDIPPMAKRLADAAAAYAEASSQDRTSRSVPPPPNPELYAGLAPEVEAVLLRALRGEVEERYPTIDAAADDLEPYAEGPLSTSFAGRSLLPHAEVPAASARASSAPAGLHAAAGPGALRGLPPAAVPGPMSARATSRDDPPRSVGPMSARAASAPAVPAPRSSAAAPEATLSDTGATTNQPAVGTAADTPQGEPAPGKKIGRGTGRMSLVLLGFAAVAAGAVALLGTRRPQEPALTSPPAPAVAAPPVVARVPCASAEVRGAASVGDAAVLFGRGACVRLAVALGVPWDPAPSGAPLSATIEIASPARATLALSGQTASGEGPSPMTALDSAARALAEKLAAPPTPADRQRALGASSETEARRIDAALSRRAARLTLDPGAELAEATAAAPASPWLKLAALTSGAAGAARLRDEAVNNAGALPAPFGEAARGAARWLAPATGTDRTEGLAALRRAYAAAPDDSLVAAMTAEALLGEGLYEEAAAIALRSADVSPSGSLDILAELGREGPADPAWYSLRGRLLDALERLLPEARGWDTRALHEALCGNVERARESLALGDALGLPSAAGRAWARDLTRAAVEIAADHPEKAREYIQPSLGSPSPAEAALAARLLIQSYLLQGRAADAETALARDLSRLEALGDAPRTAERWLTALGLRRRLGLPPPDFIDLGEVEAALPALQAEQGAVASALRAELFLIELAAKRRRSADAADVRRAVEESARQAARGDRARQDDLTMAIVPLVFVTKGHRGLRDVWRSMDRARFAARLPHLLAWGLACEEARDMEEAERAYRAVVASPLSVSGMDNIAARVRLARVLENLGKREEALKWRASAERLLSGADAGVAGALQKH